MGLPFTISIGPTDDTPCVQGRSRGSPLPRAAPTRTSTSNATTISQRPNVVQLMLVLRRLRRHRSRIRSQRETSQGGSGIARRPISCLSQGRAEAAHPGDRSCAGSLRGALPLNADQQPPRSPPCGAPLRSDGREGSVFPAGAGPLPTPRRAEPPGANGRHPWLGNSEGRPTDAVNRERHR